jgi:DNA topoisomerase-2
MHLFDENEVIHRYKTVEEIMEGYYGIRLECYEKRQQYQLDIIAEDIRVLENKYRFVKGVNEDVIIIHKKTREELEKLLDDMKFDRMIKETKLSFNYLLRMPIESFTKDMVQKIEDMLMEKRKDYAHLEGKTPGDMWTSELTSFEKEYSKQLKVFEKENMFEKKITK